jgi:hypothetical protein
MSGERVVGPLVVRFLPPDIVSIAVVGDVTASSMVALRDEIGPFAAGKPYIFGIADFARFGTMTAEGRKAAAEISIGIIIAATACVNASFHHRVLMTLIAKTVSLFRKEKYRVGFFKTEDEAHAWIEQQRAELQARH